MFWIKVKSSWDLMQTFSFPSPSVFSPSYFPRCSETKSHRIPQGLFQRKNILDQAIRLQGLGLSLFSLSPPYFLTDFSCLSVSPTGLCGAFLENNHSLIAL